MKTHMLVRDLQPKDVIRFFRKHSREVDSVEYYPDGSVIVWTYTKKGTSPIVGFKLKPDMKVPFEVKRDGAIISPMRIPEATE